VEGESSDSWFWFLERLKQMIVRDVPNVCLVHDRYKGILQVIDDIKKGALNVKGCHSGRM